MRNSDNPGDNLRGLRSRIFLLE